MKLKRPVKASLTLRRPEPAPGVERDPSASQTPEEITEYYRNAKVGDPACIRMTYNISITRSSSLRRILHYGKPFIQLAVASPILWWPHLSG